MFAFNIIKISTIISSISTIILAYENIIDNIM